MQEAEGGWLTETVSARALRGLALRVYGRRRLATCPYCAILPAWSRRHLAVSVVDDDESIREALDALFWSVGLRVATFASAEEHLQRDGPASTEA